ncbi:MAG: lipid-A-disaccharide synthase [Xanthomonadaceae bacterium]|jgi:lipid-A-disaccharide synthase|nr:lipid-A-disaccharide synthase [Xanthomonadaceae bacterium]
MQSSATPRSYPRIVLIAGETSGDMLGAGLIQALRERFPHAEFVGIGGDAMRKAGCQTWHDASELSIMGLAEVIGHLPRLLKLRKEFRKRALEWEPDVVIGIDSPDFNLSIERWFKRRGIYTIHYVSPSVWAWRENRIDKIRACADEVLCLFPMEPALYAEHRVNARFVGHPVADAIPLEPNHLAARAELKLPENVPILAMLPGSRRSEIERLSQVFLDAAWRVYEKLPDLHVVIPAANTDCYEYLSKALSSSLLPKSNLHLIQGQSRTAMIAADVALLASGTATLEAMLCKCPMVVGYRISPLTYSLVKTLHLVKTNRYALPNILAGQSLVPELIQSDCTADRLSAEILNWLCDPQRAMALQPIYRKLHMSLRQDASERAADAVAAILEPVPLPT